MTTDHAFQAFDVPRHLHPGLPSIYSFLSMRLLLLKNCNALGVPHSSNQCRGKWNLLLHDYKKIKRWQSQSVLCDSYWSLGGQRRKEYELPENFDEDLFKTINNVVRLLEDKSGTDRDSDPEAHDEMLEIIADLGIVCRYYMSMLLVYISLNV